MEKIVTRILIVDDDERIRDLLRVTLADDTYKLLEAPDGACAVQITKTEPLDIVILDIMIPPPDGIEVLSYLRRLPKK